MSLLIRILDKSYWGLLWVETHPYLSCMEIRPVVFVQSCWQTNQSANGHEKHNLLCEGNDRLFCSSVLDIMPSLRSLSNKICNEKGSLADALLKVFIIIQLQEVSINGAHFKCIKCIISGLFVRTVFPTERLCVWLEWDSNHNQGINRSDVIPERVSFSANHVWLTVDGKESASVLIVFSLVLLSK